VEFFSRYLPQERLCRKDRISLSWQPQSSSLRLPDARRLIPQMPAPNLLRHKPTIWPQPTGHSKPVPMTNSSLRRQSASRTTDVPMAAMTTPATTTSTVTMASPCFRHKSPHQSCRNIRSLNAPAMAISGRPDTGAMHPGVTTGSQAPGRNRLKWATCGPRDIGDFMAAGIVITTVHGVSMSATTVALTMDSAMAEPATRAGTGADAASIITAPSTT